MPLIDVPIVHAVTDSQILADPGFKSKAEAVFRALGPAGAVHLRAATVPAGVLHTLADYLASVQSVTGCWLVINDRLDIAAATGAIGVQLGRRSLTLAHVRQTAFRTTARYGVSVHNCEEAHDAVSADADWLLAGNVFETPSHPDRPAKGVDLIREIARSGAVVIAIGGVLPAHARQLRDAGAHGVAAIRGVWHADNAGRAAAAYLSALR